MRTTLKLILIQILFVAITLTFFTAWNFYNSYQYKLFIRSLHENNEKFIDQVLASQQDDMIRPLNDNSEWDQTRKYLETPTRKFEEECINTLLGTFSFNAIYIYDTFGSIFYSVDDSSNQVLDHLLSGINIKEVISQKHPHCHFFISADSSLFEIFGATIVPTEDDFHKSPPKGFMFFVKSWDPKVIQQLSSLSRTSISLIQGNKNELQPSSTDSDYIRKDLKDHSGKTIGQIRFVINHSVVREWKRNLKNAWIIFTSLAVFMVIAFGRIFRRWISTPLHKTIRGLKYSEARFAQVAEHADEWIWELSSQGMFVYSNGVVERVLGYKPEEIVGHKSYSEFLPPEQKDELHQRIKTEALNRKKIIDYQWPMIHKNGSLVILQASCSPFFDNDGQWLGYRGTFLDITEKQKTLQKLKDALHKAEENDQLKTAFLNNISHEIRTPMNAIIGFTDLLDNSHNDPEKRHAYTEVIHSAGLQLLSIIDDISSIATVESGQEKARMNDLNLNRVLRRLYDQFQLKTNDKPIELSVRPGLPDDKAIIRSDEVKLVQIISNLLINAFKFTRRGRIEFGYHLKDGLIEFYVSDTGIGIPRKYHSVVFERFRQVDSTGTREYGGTGLGLSICKAYVELLGGSIRVNSTPGEGSVFYFTLPYSVSSLPLQVTEKESASPQQENVNNMYSILVVEDEDLNFLLIDELLSGLEHKTIRAKDGLTAVELFRNDPTIDLVLMDLKIPGIDGYDATRRIKEYRKDIPVIVQSAFIQQEAKIRAMEAGADDFITKPFSRETFLGIVKRFLN